MKGSRVVAGAVVALLFAGCASSPERLHAGPGAKPVLEVTAEPAEVAPGETVTLRVTVRNAGTDPLVFEPKPLDLRLGGWCGFDAVARDGVAIRPNGGGEEQVAFMGPPRVDEKQFVALAPGASETVTVLAFKERIEGRGPGKLLAGDPPGRTLPLEAGTYTATASYRFEPERARANGGEEIEFASEEARELYSECWRGELEAIGRFVVRAP